MLLNIVSSKEILCVVLFTVIISTGNSLQVNYITHSALTESHNYTSQFI